MMRGGLGRSGIGMPTNKRAIGYSVSPSSSSSLLNKLLVGWSGSSATSDFGLSNVIISGTSQNLIKKLGAASLFYAENQNTATNIRLNDFFVNTAKFSIICWAYFNNFGTGGTTHYGGPWASWDSGSVASGALLFFNGSGTNATLPQFLIASGSNSYAIAASSGSWQPFVWYLTICEVDKPAGKMYFYMNNSLVGQRDIPVNLILNTGSDTFSFGGYALSNNVRLTNMDGYLDQILILNDLTSENEREWLWNNGAGNLLLTT